jgi:hypothetical protein
MSTPLLDCRERLLPSPGLSALRLFFLEAVLFVDRLEVKPVVICMGANVPDVNDGAGINDANHKAIIVVADVKDDKLVSNWVSTPIGVSNVVWP